MTLAAGAFARLQQGLPPLAPTTELILRPDGDVPLAMLRPKGAPPRAFVLQDDAVSELQPHADHGLPAAALLGDAGRLCAALLPALGVVREPQLVAWRPGRRAVVRLLCAHTAVFVKFLDKKTWKRAQQTFATLATAPAPLQFANATALLPQLCAYAAAAAPGTSLRDRLAAGTAPDWRLVDGAITALAATATTADLPRHDFASAHRASVKMLDKAASLDAEYGELARRLHTMAAPRQHRTGFVHGDLHDKQLFLTHDQATLIDLEGVGQGDPTFDLVNLAEHLRLRALQQAGHDDGSAAALLDRFQVVGDERMRWSACVRARLCGVYALRPRWADLTRRLLSETRSLLDGLA